MNNGGVGVVMIVGECVMGGRCVRVGMETRDRLGGGACCLSDNPLVW
jgi:hypothetical protein